MILYGKNEKRVGLFHQDVKVHAFEELLNVHQP